MLRGLLALVAVLFWFQRVSSTGPCHKVWLLRPPCVGCHQPRRNVFPNESSSSRGESRRRLSGKAFSVSGNCRSYALRLRSETKTHARPKTSGAKVAQIVFLNVIHNFLGDRAFTPASECYASNDSNIVRLRLVCMPGGKACSGHARDFGGLILGWRKFSLAPVRSRCRP